jgi:hypothetical protein
LSFSSICTDCHAAQCPAVIAPYLICAKCAKNKHRLTVHHKDENPRNNPSDGSNWENLCVYYHDDEQSRELMMPSDKPRREKGTGYFSSSPHKK